MFRKVKKSCTKKKNEQVFFATPDIFFGAKDELNSKASEKCIMKKTFAEREVS
jgi:hypothetical protein